MGTSKNFELIWYENDKLLKYRFTDWFNYLFNGDKWSPPYQNF